MDFLNEYWLLIALALIVLALVAFLALRPRQQVTLTDSAPIRPHMARSQPAEGRGIAGEAAAATSNIAAEILGAPVRQALDGQEGGSDDLSRIKGIGPRFAETLNGLGFTRYDQIAALTPTEVERLDAQLGAFRGRIARDRIVEQADYLARGDTDGFEERFGKL